MSRLLTWLFFATLSLILLLQLRGIDAPLSAVTPGGIVAYELAFTADRAKAILDVWRIAGVTESARVSLGVDVGFLLVYPWFFWWSVRLLRTPRFTATGSTMYRAGGVLGAAVLACMPLDALWHRSPRTRGVGAGLRHLQSREAVVFPLGHRAVALR